MIVLLLEAFLFSVLLCFTVDCFICLLPHVFRSIVNHYVDVLSLSDSCELIAVMLRDLLTSQPYDESDLMI